MLNYTEVSFTVSEKPTTYVLELFQVDAGVYKLFIKGNKNRFTDVTFNKDSTFEDFKKAIECLNCVVVGCTGL